VASILIVVGFVFGGVLQPEIRDAAQAGRMCERWLQKGTTGDATNAILCGAGHNQRKILARIRAFFIPAQRRSQESPGRHPGSIGLDPFLPLSISVA